MGGVVQDDPQCAEQAQRLDGVEHGGALDVAAVFQVLALGGAALPDTALEVGLAGDGVFDDPVRVVDGVRGVEVGVASVEPVAPSGGEKGRV